MKNTLWIVSAAIVAGGAYYFFAPDQVEAPAVVAEQPVVEEPVVESVEEDVAAVEETVSQAVEDVITSAEPTEDAVNDALTSVIATVKEKAGEAGESTTDLAKQVQDLAADGVDAAREGAAEIPEYLTFEGFDLDKVKDFIDTSELSATQKTFLTTAVTKAQESPEVLKAALEQVQSALGYGS